MDRRTRKEQAVRFPQLALRPLRSGMSEHATPRAKGAVRKHRGTLGLPLRVDSPKKWVFRGSLKDNSHAEQP